MKILLVLPVLGVVGYVGAVVQAVQHPTVNAKGQSREYFRREAIKDVRIARALTSLRKGDQSQRSEVRGVIAGLGKGDSRRVTFAAALADRGETQAAFEVQKTYMHFLETSVTSDREVEAYAKLADRTGHPDEAAWARDRLGLDGHFRIWKRTEENSLSYARSLPSYESTVNYHMDDGLRLYPEHEDEIERLRQKLLATQQKNSRYLLLAMVFKRPWPRARGDGVRAQWMLQSSSISLF